MNIERIFSDGHIQATPACGHQKSMGPSLSIQRNDDRLGSCILQIFQYKKILLCLEFNYKLWSVGLPLFCFLVCWWWEEGGFFQWDIACVVYIDTGWVWSMSCLSDITCGRIPWIFLVSLLILVDGGKAQTFSGFCMAQSKMGRIFDAF